MNTQHNVSFELRLLHNAIQRRFNSIAPPAPCKGTTHLQGMIVAYLSKPGQKDIFQKDVENEFHIRRSTASATLKLMEKNGLLRRESVPQDARLKRLVLTDMAQLLHKQAEGYMQQIEEELTQGISKEELETCFQVLQLMRRNIEQKAPQDSATKIGGIPQI